MICYFFTIPGVNVYVDTNHRTLLSLSPYNNIDISCSVSYEPQSLNLQIQQFYWFQTVDDGTLNITDFGQSNVTHSILDLKLIQPGIHTFKCVIYFGNQRFLYSNTIVATVKGKLFNFNLIKCFVVINRSFTSHGSY